LAEDAIMLQSLGDKVPNVLRQSALGSEFAFEPAAGETEASRSQRASVGWTVGRGVFSAARRKRPPIAASRGVLGVIDYAHRLGTAFNFGRRSAGAEAEPADFDLLRVNIERTVSPSAVIAITSATPADGKELAARGLAYSLSMCGYSTLFIDTAVTSRSLAAPPHGLGIEEIGRRQAPNSSGEGKVAVLTLDDITLQRTTSLRGMKAALEILRSKFDYVVISTEFDGANAFGAVVAATADAVLASVVTGRRRAHSDAQLASSLDQIGSRFVGLIAMCPRIIASNTAAQVPAPVLPVEPRTVAPSWATRLGRAWRTRLAADGSRGDSTSSSPASSGAARTRMLGSPEGLLVEPDAGASPTAPNELLPNSG
jgi:Mrp family chromosome partitioning ATPase